jgi:adenine-specific DNA-methyltransferase
MSPRKTSSSSKKVESLKHDDATRKNIPTAEYQSVMAEDEKSPIRVAYERRNRDLDPQLVWRGKDEQDWSDLVVNACPTNHIIYRQNLFTLTATSLECV